MAAVRYSLGVFHRFPRIGEKRLHFLFAFDIVLTAHIAHSVLIRQLFTGLQTEQYIMGVHIFLIGIVHIVGDHQFNAGFLA